MKEFLRHSVAHLDQILKETIDDPSKPKVEEIIKLGEEEVKFAREMRVGAPWVNLEDNVYLISIATEDRLITNHPAVPSLVWSQSRSIRRQYFFKPIINEFRRYCSFLRCL